jgi:Na+/H+-dicarboxylate symporter
LLLVGSAFVLLGIMHQLDTSTLGMVGGLLRVAFLLLGAGALLLGITAVRIERTVCPAVSAARLILADSATPPFMVR